MSRMISETVAGDIHSAVAHVSMTRGTQFVFGFYPLAGQTITNIVYKFTDYPGYEHWCEKNHRTPMTSREFFE